MRQWNILPNPATHILRIIGIWPGLPMTDARIGLQDGSCIISSGTEMEEIETCPVRAILGEAHISIVPATSIQQVRAIAALALSTTALKHTVR